VAVTTTRQSQAMITWAWRRRKVDHRMSPLGKPGGREGRYFRTVRGDTCPMPVDHRLGMSGGLKVFSLETGNRQ
jgi:hypothetical protein